MKGLKIEDIRVTEYELDENIDSLFIEFPMPIGKCAFHSEIDGVESRCIYMFDELENGNLTYLEIANYQDAVVHDFCDLPFNFKVEYKGKEYMLKDLLIKITKPLKEKLESEMKRNGGL